MKTTYRIRARRFIASFSNDQRKQGERILTVFLQDRPEDGIYFTVLTSVGWLRREHLQPEGRNRERRGHPTEVYVSIKYLYRHETATPSDEFGTSKLKSRRCVRPVKGNMQSESACDTIYEGVCRS